MTSYEIINNHEGIIFFYPFSGTDFNIITELRNLATVFNKKVLFIYCSFGGSQEEYENFTIENRDKARGLHTDANNIANKLGLKGIEVSSFQKLIDVNHPYPRHGEDAEGCDLRLVGFDQNQLQL